MPLVTSPVTGAGIKTMKTLTVLIAAVSLFGCAAQNKSIRVIRSNTPIEVKMMDVQDGDAVMCDPEGCRKLK